jgi:uncharacterized membrane protein
VTTGVLGAIIHASHSARPQNVRLMMSQAINHWLNQFCVWLDQTPVSQTIQTEAWIVPTVQTIHILAIAVVATSALMIDLRLIGIVGRNQPPRHVGERFLPFVWWSLLVLLVTGTIMIIGEPTRALKNSILQLKIALILAAIVLTAILQTSLTKNATAGDNATRARGALFVIAIASIVLWGGIICAGRRIAYS